MSRMRSSYRLDDPVACDGPGCCCKYASFVGLSYLLGGSGAHPLLPEELPRSTVVAADEDVGMTIVSWS
jgi:hypothetical protein